jgi:hypothetical protein
MEVYLPALIEGIVVSPEASAGTAGEIRKVVSEPGYTIPVHESSFRQYSHVITDPRLSGYPAGRRALPLLPHPE